MPAVPLTRPDKTGARQEKEDRRKEAALKKENEKMLKSIGQLTLERDFLQDCFRVTGKPVPKMHRA